jgi:hypothetical protein
MWSERLIASEIARQTLARKCVVLVDNCNWTGHECDVLGVTTDLRIIDVEVKISRADLKADARKNKWWHSGGSWREWAGEKRTAPIAREWPPKVWKHYYALPADIWRDDLIAALPSPKSGVLLLSQKPGEFMRVDCRRRATPCKDATRLTPANAVDIARLANLRMWEAYRDVERERDTNREWRRRTLRAEAYCGAIPW